MALQNIFWVLIISPIDRSLKTCVSAPCETESPELFLGLVDKGIEPRVWGFN